MRKVFLFVLLGLMAAFMTAGCAKKGALITEPGAEGRAMRGTETVTEESPQIAKLGKEDITGKYIEDVAVSVEFEDIHFDFDRYNIRDDARPTLDNLSSYLAGKDAKVIIEGHCDERGTDEYNLALGDRRAQSTKQYLMASGVSPDRIETVSYGEEKPLCGEKNESCWFENRRAHFIILVPK